MVCYCNDCQDFLSIMERSDRLDKFGGTEIVPVYPSDIKILQGKEYLQCHRLTKNGLYRWSASCCISPIANTRAEFPWVGLFHSTFTSIDSNSLNRLGKIKCRIFGRDAKKGAPFPISPKIGFSDMLVVLPFVIKGKILKKHRHSPFFEDDGRTPISPSNELNPSVQPTVANSTTEVPQPSPGRTHSNTDSV